MNDIPENGFHVRAMEEHAVDDVSIKRITIEVWPIPESISRELALYLMHATRSFMFERGFTTGDITDVSIPKSKPH